MGQNSALPVFVSINGAKHRSAMFLKNCNFSRNDNLTESGLLVALVEVLIQHFNHSSHKFRPMRSFKIKIYGQYDSLLSPRQCIKF